MPRAGRASPGSNLTKTDRVIIGSRYVYDLYYEKEAISKQLYDWLLKNGYADANLIAKWKKQGYEKVCAPFPPSPGAAAAPSPEVLANDG